MNIKNLVKFLISVLALVLTDRLFSSVYFDSYITVVLFAFVLWLLNLFVKPLLIILTLPVTLFTLGFFLLIINAMIVLLAARLIEGIQIHGFWTAFWFSIVYSFIKLILESIFVKDVKVKIHVEKR